MRYRLIGRILREQWPNVIRTLAGCHRIAGRMPQEYSSCGSVSLFYKHRILEEWSTSKNRLSIYKNYRDNFTLTPQFIWGYIIWCFKREGHSLLAYKLRKSHGYLDETELTITSNNASSISGVDIPLVKYVLKKYYNLSCSSIQFMDDEQYKSMFED